MTAIGLLLTALILVGVAALFLAAELFFPSHGILGIFAAMFALGAVGTFFMLSAVLGAISALILAVVAPLVVYWAIRLYPDTPVGRRVMLHKPSAEQLQPFSRESISLQSLTGKRGIAATTLRPAGTCEFDGQRVDSVSEAEAIEAGTLVEVVRVVGLKVIVKPVKA